MKTQMSKFTPETQWTNFQELRIEKDQLHQIKGGDGDTPPDDGDGVIGVEEIAGM